MIKETNRRLKENEGGEDRTKACGEEILLTWQFLIDRLAEKVGKFRNKTITSVNSTTTGRETKEKPEEWMLGLKLKRCRLQCSSWYKKKRAKLVIACNQKREFVKRSTIKFRQDQEGRMNLYSTINDSKQEGSWPQKQRETQRQSVPKEKKKDYQQSIRGEYHGPFPFWFNIIVTTYNTDIVKLWDTLQ